MTRRIHLPERPEREGQRRRIDPLRAGDQPVEPLQPRAEVDRLAGRHHVLVVARVAVARRRKTPSRSEEVSRRQTGSDRLRPNQGGPASAWCQWRSTRLRFALAAPPVRPAKTASSSRDRSRRGTRPRHQAPDHIERAAADLPLGPQIEVLPQGLGDEGHVEEVDVGLGAEFACRPFDVGFKHCRPQ